MYGDEIKEGLFIYLFILEMPIMVFFYFNFHISLSLQIFAMFVDCYDLEKIKNCFSALWATFSFYQNGGENIAVRPRMQFLQETLYKLPVLKMIFY